MTKVLKPVKKAYLIKAISDRMKSRQDFDSKEKC